MTGSAGPGCAPCAPGGCGKRCIGTFKDGVFSNNPVWTQVLGICSCLAVTNRLENALVMGVALVFVTSMSSLFVSVLRNTIPHRIRMIVEVALIATFVIVFDQILKAFYWEMSKQLGPYVGLIITNCIVMGRAEGFALQNSPLYAVVDGAANGVGYGLLLAGIAVVRELFGTGRLLGLTVLSESWYTPNQLLILAPGAFFVMGLIIALVYALGWGGEAVEEKSR